MFLHEAIQKLRSLLTEIYPEHEANSISHYYFECKTGFSRIKLYECRQNEIDWDELKCDVTRLLKHEPVQYVTGIAWFCGLKFSVANDVLIPRPETEELVEKAKEIINNDFRRLITPTLKREIVKNPSKQNKILDIGTGSGCIAIAIKKLFPHAEIHASDFSETAIKIAKHNAEKNHTEINFIKDDILQSRINDQFDIILSNPPYVTEKEKKQMQKNVLEFEPHSALFVPDDDSLKFYIAITRFAYSRLNPSGYLFFEINEAYKEDVCNLLVSYNFTNIESFRDINNKWRIVKAQKA